MSSTAYELFVLIHSPDMVGEWFEQAARELAGAIIAGRYPYAGWTNIDTQHD